MEIIEMEKFPGYGIDKNGNLYSGVKRKTIRDKNGKIAGMTVIRIDQWTKLKTCIDNHGYETAYIKKRPCRVHRELAKVFIPNPSNLPYVCHKNGIQTDNRIINLYWGTPKQNQQDRIKHGTQCAGENSGCSKLNNRKIKLIRLLFSEFKWQPSKIAKMFSVTKENIYYIIHRKTWRHIA